MKHLSEKLNKKYDIYTYVFLSAALRYKSFLLYSHEITKCTAISIVYIISSMCVPNLTQQKIIDNLSYIFFLNITDVGESNNLRIEKNILRVYSPSFVSRYVHVNAVFKEY